MSECDIIHQPMKEAIQRHEKWLEQHDEDIEELKISDASKKTQIDNLCDNLKKQAKAISGLTKAIWGFIVSIFMALMGFLIWYIQNK